MSHQTEIVTLFYKGLWDKADKSLIPTIFHEGFTFRGSLGPVLVGHEAFAGYVDFVTGALENYTSDILELVEQDNRVAGRLRFHGLHRAELFGFAPTGKHVAWAGAPFFTFEGDKVRDLWVLGDVNGLLEQLRANQAAWDPGRA
ncbi:ester cyclase [Phreatobacter sp. AB_2022a]|uniref:ester cyclase n=1 Tax=Phreatobacter sp. AB_2022a TaxID=3003134 RepID=UPI00056E4B39|nr:ester cyclase [Phreatobacter sp. AB_2022a]MCZ0736371.1 ester cyclase [Phreatobacter sp. AB_2022a]CEJ14255.1 SnoaL-like polyketide cyclase [bacterium YEK0313]